MRAQAFNGQVRAVERPGRADDEILRFEDRAGRAVAERTIHPPTLTVEAISVFPPGRVCYPIAQVGPERSSQSIGSVQLFGIDKIVYGFP